MRKITLPLAAAAALSITAPAQAAVYVADFTVGAHTGTLTLTTATDASLGLTALTGLTGTVDGDAVVLVAPGGINVSPSNDNLFTTTSPFFDLGGIGFQDTITSTFFNLYSSGGTVLACVGPNTVSCNFAATFTVQTAGGVPEPGTWAMMLLGFGAIGLFLRRRKAVAALA